jgi:hypothetical protein
VIRAVDVRETSRERSDPWLGGGGGSGSHFGVSATIRSSGFRGRRITGGTGSNSPNPPSVGLTFRTTSMESVTGHLKYQPAQRSHDNHQTAMTKPSTSRKCRSRVARTSSCEVASAAIQMSFSGMGFPFARRSCFSRPYSRATRRSQGRMVLPTANCSSLAEFS